MATSVSRLKEIVRDHEFRTYEELLLYVHGHCGERLRKEVVDARHDLTRYIDARSVAREKPDVYRKPSKYRPLRLKYKK